MNALYIIALSLFLMSAAPYVEATEPTTSEPPDLVVYQFNDKHRDDGMTPTSGVVFGPDGSLYGTTMAGGSFKNHGALFKIDPTGRETIIHSFSLQYGDMPFSQLIFGNDGNLYGTLSGSGPANIDGVIYRVATNGSQYTVLHAGEATPSSGLLLASNGRFYGATLTDYERRGEVSTIYELQSDGTYTILHTLQGFEGVGPYSTLIEGTDGKLYGTTVAGGINGLGTIYRLDVDGQNFEVLHSFTQDEGGGTLAPLLQVADGNFYGTTTKAAFDMSPSGAVTILHAFLGEGSDGFQPSSGLVVGKDGMLYGTTKLGGATTKSPQSQAEGTVYRMDLLGEVTIIQSFPVIPFGIGFNPESANHLALGPDGYVYGVCSNGGIKTPHSEPITGMGTVFKVNSAAQ